MSEQLDKNTNTQDQVADAVEALSEFGERVAYGGVAFIITSIVLVEVWGFEPSHAAEPAILNAGLAYYSHAASGRIIRAFVAVAGAKLPSKKVRMKANQEVEVTDA